jgi:hypothetical protein
MLGQSFTVRVQTIFVIDLYESFAFFLSSFSPDSVDGKYHTDLVRFDYQCLVKPSNGSEDDDGNPVETLVVKFE